MTENTTPEQKNMHRPNGASEAECAADNGQEQASHSSDADAAAAEAEIKAEIRKIGSKIFDFRGTAHGAVAGGDYQEFTDNSISAGNDVRIDRSTTNINYFLVDAPAGQRESASHKPATQPFTGDIDTWRRGATDYEVCQLVALATLHGSTFEQIMLAADDLFNRVLRGRRFETDDSELGKLRSSTIIAQELSTSEILSKLGAARYKISHAVNHVKPRRVGRRQTTGAQDHDAAQEGILFKEVAWADVVLLYAWGEYPSISGVLGEWLVCLGRNRISAVRQLSADAAGILFAASHQRALAEVLRPWMAGESRYRRNAARAIIHAAKSSSDKLSYFDMLTQYACGAFGPNAFAVAALALGEGLAELDPDYAVRLMLILVEQLHMRDPTPILLGMGRLMDGAVDNEALFRSLVLGVAQWPGWQYLDEADGCSRDRLDALVSLAISRSPSLKEAPDYFTNLRTLGSRPKVNKLALTLIALAAMRLLSIGADEEDRINWVRRWTCWGAKKNEISQAIAHILFKCMRVPECQTEIRTLLDQVFKSAAGHTESTKGLKNVLFALLGRCGAREDAILRPVVNRWRAAFPHFWRSQ